MRMNYDTGVHLYNKEVYFDILNHIEKFKFITINQCGNIFYPKHKFPNQQARRSLNRLVEGGFIKVWKKIGYQNIYYNIKPITRSHPIILMDFYSLFIKNNFDIKYFATEVDFGIKVPDGVLEYINSKTGKIIPLLVEIDCFNKTKLKTLENLYDSNVVQEYYLKRYGVPIFPNVVIISATKRTDYSEKVKIIHMTHDLLEFHKYFRAS